MSEQSDDELGSTLMAECYLCGCIASTSDHVPPQGFFLTIPENIIQLPACNQCNHSASLDEEYMRTTLAALSYATSPVARGVWDGAVKRSFVRRPKGLKARLAQALTTVQIKTAAGTIAGYFGIRLAVGASRGAILRVVLIKAAKLVSIGIGLGLAGAVLLARVIASLLYGVTPFDLPTLASVSNLLAMVALVASYLPAMRGANVNPMDSLRCE